MQREHDGPHGHDSERPRVGGNYFISQLRREGGEEQVTNGAKRKRRKLDGGRKLMNGLQEGTRD